MPPDSSLTVVNVGYRSTNYYVLSAGTSRLLVDLGWPGTLGVLLWAKPQDRFVDITLHDNVIVTAEDSRGLLRGLGIHGEIVPTPGHSDDSVSLLLDTGFVFSGDLPDPARTTAESAAMVEHSWRVLRERGATTVYPGHGPVRPMP
jgi:endoribonuclease LACTB2